MTTFLTGATIALTAFVVGVLTRAGFDHARAYRRGHDAGFLRGIRDLDTVHRSLNTDERRRP